MKNKSERQKSTRQGSTNSFSNTLPLKGTASFISKESESPGPQTTGAASASSFSNSAKRASWSLKPDSTPTGVFLVYLEKVNWQRILNKHRLKVPSTKVFTTNITTTLFPHWPFSVMAAIGVVYTTELTCLGNRQNIPTQVQFSHHTPVLPSNVYAGF